MDDIVTRLHDGTKLPALQALMDEAADEIGHLRSELMVCRNELCLRCGSYKQKHLGACEGCRWA